VKSTDEGKSDIIINIPDDSAKTFEFHKAPKLIEKGREAAQQSIRGFSKRK